MNDENLFVEEMWTQIMVIATHFSFHIIEFRKCRVKLFKNGLSRMGGP